MMTKLLTQAGLAVAISLTSTGYAQAATTIPQTFVLTPNQPNPIPLAYFDSNLGTLQSVSLSYSYSLAGAVTVTNPDSTPITGSNIYQAFVVLRSNSNEIFSLSSASAYQRDFGTMTYQPSETKTFLINSGLVSGTLTDTTISDLAALSRAGGGSSDLYAALFAGFISPATQNRPMISNSVTGAGSLSVSYNYAAAATAGAVPEPATWAMMVLGFGAMGYAMRRRDKAAARIRFA